MVLAQSDFAPLQPTNVTPTERQALASFRWPEGLVLRQRKAEDTKALFELLSQEDFQRNGSALDPFTSVEDVAAVLRASLPGSFETVAVIEQTIVGFAGLYPLGGRQRHVGNFTLCVDARFQNRGIGSVLMATIIMTARVMMGLQRLQLAVFTDNQRAIALYQRFGFAVEGRLACFAQRTDGFVDAFMMAATYPLA